MSLELAAQHLASRGRKGDSMLVHMAPEEVSGLQALARAGGGTLTLNPDTGLPEANFLKRMLPMLIGAGITAATGGAAAPWMVGLGLGGLETARTGSLEKGLMAGLGAYGGAGVAGGLMGAGNAAVSQAASAASPGFVGPMPGAVSGMDALGAGIKNLGTAGGPSAAISSMGGGMDAAKYGLAALSPMMQPETAKPYDGGGPNPYEFEYDPATQRYTRMPVGTRQRDMLAPTTPMMAADGGMMNSGPIEAMSDQNRMDTMMANGGQMFAAGGQVNLQGTFTAGDQGGGGPFGQANANGYQAAGSGGPIPGFSSSFGQMGGGMGGFDPRAVQANPQGFAQHMAQMQQREQQIPGSTMMGRPQGGSLQQLAAQRTPEQRAADQRQMESLTGYGPNGFNNGGSNQMVGDMRYRPERDNATIAANQANSNFSSYAAGGMASMAQGGMSHLGDYSDGGRLLKGPGDGTSDNIPGVIAGKRPARLADGEFVVSADVVSGLGNGSTDAGARKLYAMMDRVRKARTGTKQMGKTINPDRLVPA
jgi:hypothetical protein